MKKFIFLVICIGVLFGSAVIPNPNLDFKIKVIGHILGYAILTFSLIVVFKSKISKVLIVAVPIALFFALSTEGLQLLIPTRGGSLRDIGIDSIGILIAVGVWFLIKIRKNRRR